MNLKTLLTISLFLTGCSTPLIKPADPVVITKYVLADCGTPPKRTIIELHEIEFKIAPNPQNIYGWWLSEYEYRKLAHNSSQTLLGTKELKAEIKYYTDCLTREIKVPSQ